ncbi:hypothetical protein [Rhodococcus opacus]|uniref:hypothetical protein n=1 Tax=Rhodococcus opacus TaxID=37919 RepID=UPI0018E17BAC
MAEKIAMQVQRREKQPGPSLSHLRIGPRRGQFTMRRVVEPVAPGDGVPPLLPVPIKRGVQEVDPCTHAPVLMRERFMPALGFVQGVERFLMCGPGVLIGAVPSGQRLGQLLPARLPAVTVGTRPSAQRAPPRRADLVVTLDLGSDGRSSGVLTVDGCPQRELGLLRLPEVFDRSIQL